MSRPRRRWLIILAAAELTVTGTVVVLLWGSTTRLPADVGTVPVAVVAPQVDVLPSLGRSPAAPRSKLKSPSPSPSKKPLTGSPRRVRVTAVGIDAAVVPVSVDPGGALGVPEDVRTLGWWSQGAKPGARKGTVVIDGHVDSKEQGRGELFPLERAKPGDAITVTTVHGDVHYVIAARKVYAKVVLPEDVFDQSGEPRLVLITCGGAFDEKTRHYADNIVVYAVPS